MGFFDIFHASAIKQENEQLKSQIAELQSYNDNLKKNLKDLSDDRFQLKQNFDELQKTISGETQRKLQQDLDQIKQILVNFRTQEEAAQDCLKIHVYQDNRKIGIVKIYPDNTAEFKIPGQNAVKINNVEDLQKCLK